MVKKTSSKNAPVGVKIISVLVYIQAFFSVIVGLMMMLLKGFIVNFIDSFKVVPTNFMPLINAAFLVIGIFLILLGILYYLLARGLWKGSSWARVVELILASLGAFGGLISLPSGIIGLVISGLIIWYLGFNKEGKEYFS